MTKPDVIITWPRNTDYPLWRQFIRDNRTRFNEVIIVFTETYYGPDYRDFLRAEMFQDHVLLVQSPDVRAGEDWRDIAVNAALIHSMHSEWIWFTEQDFSVKEGFWEDVESLSGCDAIAAYDGDRMHPCCIFIKREVLNKTKKQFGANPPEHDHFGQLQKDLEYRVNTGDLAIAVLKPNVYNHMAGLSHNMRLLYDGEKPNHKVDEFNRYLAECMRGLVHLDPEFVELVTPYLNDVAQELLSVKNQ